MTKRVKVNDEIVAHNKVLCDGIESIEDQFELSNISKIYDLAFFSFRMRQKMEPKGEFGLDSSILLDGKMVSFGDILTSLATGYKISDDMDDVITCMSNALNENDSKIPISKRFTKILHSKNDKEFKMDMKIKQNEPRTFSTLTSAETFRKIIQNDILCNEVYYFRLLIVSRRIPSTRRRRGPRLEGLPTLEI